MKYFTDTVRQAKAAAKHAGSSLRANRVRSPLPTDTNAMIRQSRIIKPLTDFRAPSTDRVDGGEPCAAGGGYSKARITQRSNKSSTGAAAPRRLLRVPQAGIQSGSVKLRPETRAPSIHEIDGGEEGVWGKRDLRRRGRMKQITFRESGQKIKPCSARCGFFGHRKPEV